VSTPQTGQAAEGAGGDGTQVRPGLIDQLGGPRGLFDSGLPALVFVLVNSVAGLRPAIWAALLSGLSVVAIRVVRRETVQQALSGFFGLALAAFVAARTGSASGFFLPGIFINLAYLTVFAGSVLVGRPLVGVIWAALDGSGTTWRANPRLKRVYAVATLGWAAIFAVRATVQGLLYLADRPGWLAVAKLAGGYPVTIAAVALTIWAVRRAQRVAVAPAPAV